MKTLRLTLCMLSFLSITSLEAQLSGTYRVGNGGDFTSLSQAYDSLRTHGINGTLYLSVISDLTGTQRLNGSVPGASISNPIIITSSTHHADSFTIGTSVTSSSYALFLDNGVSHVHFKDISIGETTNSLQKCGVYFDLCNASYSNIVFKNCNINTYIGTGLQNTYAAVHYKGTNNSPYYADNLCFIHNNIRGGYYNMLFEYPAGSATGMYNRKGSIIDNNHLSDAYACGIYSNSYGFYHSISYNTITTSTSHSEYNGIFTNNYTSIDSIIGNKIHVNVSGTVYGMRLYKYQNYNLSHGALGPMFIANNEMIIHCSKCYAFYLYGNTNYSQFDVFHNSVFISGTESCQGLYWYPRDSNYKASFINNNIHISTPDLAYLFHFGKSDYITSAFAKIDYNNYYRDKNGSVSYYGLGDNNYNSLALWQSASNQDIHSTEIPMSYIDSSSSLALSNYAGLTCPRIGDLQRDIIHQSRDIITFKGCYSSRVVDAGIENACDTSMGYLINNPTPINIRLKNEGLDTLYRVDIAWTHRGVLQTPFEWTGLLEAGKDTLLCIGNVFLVSNNQNDIKIWVNNPNGMHDVDANNDTLWLDFYGCDSIYHGVYKVGGTNADFSNINEALFAFQTCGIDGAVELRLANGIYENIVFSGSLRGSSDTHTVCLTSASGNAEDVIFRSNTEAALRLDSASYFVFESICIDGESDKHGVVFNHTCRNITFKHCLILADTTATSPIQNAITYVQQADDTSYLANICFIGNHIRGGFANLYIDYACGNIQNMRLSSIAFDSNTLSHAYAYGLYANHYASFHSIFHNQIRLRPANTTQYGLYFNHYIQIDQGINGNRIFLTSDSAAYGVYLKHANADTTKGTPLNVLMANNEISIHSTYDGYGIYHYNSRAELFHNSIYVSSTHNAYGLCIASTDSSYALYIQNNILYTNSMQEAYPVFTDSLVYVTSTYNTFLDYNNYYSKGAYIAYIAGNVSNISDLQALHAQDSHSVNVNACFIDVDETLALSNYVSLICPSINSVMQDIKGENRSLYTSMGAYGKRVDTGCNVKVKALTEPVNADRVTCYPDYTKVSVEITNTGNTNIDFSKSPMVLHLDVQGAVNIHMSHTLRTGTLLSTQNDTFTIFSYLPVYANGDYNIGIISALSDDINPLDDTIKHTYRVHKINLPYSSRFDSLAMDWLFTQKQGSSQWSIVSGDGLHPPISPHFGNHRLQFSSASGAGSLAHATLYPIDLYGLLYPELTCWYAHDNANPTKADFTDIKISTDGGQTFSMLKHLERYDSSYAIPAFAKYNIDLTPYTNYHCAIIALEGVSYEGGNQNIDSIAITYQEDLAVSLEVARASDLLACELDSQSLKVHMHNLNSRDYSFDEHPLELFLGVNGAVDTLYSLSLNEGVIAANSFVTYDITHDFDFSTNGNYTLTAYIDAMDANPSNDTSVVTRRIEVDAALFALDSFGLPTSGDSIYASLHLCNSGNITIKGFPISLKLNNEEVFTTSIDTLLLPGDSIRYTLNQAFMVPHIHQKQEFNFLIEISTEVVCDGQTINNTIKRICPFIPLYVDVSLTGIICPQTDTAYAGLCRLHSIVNIENTGTLPAEEVKLCLIIDSAGIPIQSFTEQVDEITEKTKLVYPCKNAYTVPNLDGVYSLHLYIHCTDDYDTSNNGISIHPQAEKTIIDPIQEPQLDKMISLKQNIPNPAHTQTLIPFHLPHDAQVKISIMSISGQTIYQTTLWGKKGDNDFILQTKHIPNGIYFYILECDHQQYIFKMNIAH